MNKQILDIHQIRPIRNKEIWGLYKKAESAFWTLEELDFSRDKFEWDNSLNDDERYFISNILAFFSQSDFIVNINLDERFSEDIKRLPSDTKPYVGMFYDLQKSMENIHSEVYGYTLNLYISDAVKLEKLVNGIKNVSTIREKALWASKWIDLNDDTDSLGFLYRLVAFACLEGIMFSASFASIFWLRNKNILNGLIQSNRFISRDEGLHYEFAFTLFNQLKTNPEYLKEETIDYDKITSIIKEAVEIEKNFITSAFNCNLLGINSEMMSNYIEFVADRLFVNIGLDKYYNSKNPFTFMDAISLENKTNFFEKRATDYSKAGSKKNMDEDNTLSILEDF